MLTNMQRGMMQIFWDWITKHSSLILAIIILVGSLFRLVQLGNVPAGFSWDEAAITYDAWGVAEWHRDQHASFMPLVFKSFGDYKPPLMHYMLGGIFKVTDLMPIMIRVVSALAGIVLIGVVYLLAKELFPKNVLLALLSTALTALSPWSIHMSRVGFEANVATTMVAMGVLFFLWGRKQRWWVLLSFFALGLSTYMYHSTKIVVPLLVLLLLVWKIEWVKKNIRFFVLALVFLGLTQYPLLVSAQEGGLHRGEQSLLFFEPDGSFAPVSEISAQILTNVWNHFSLDFLAMGTQPTMRNIVPGYGVLYGIEVAFFILGLVLALRYDRREGWLLAGWVLIGWSPSIFSRTSPHTLRSALAMPAMLVLVSYGFLIAKQVASYWLDKRQALFLSVLAIFLYVYSVLQFGSYYFGDYSRDATYDFQFGYKEALAVAQEELRTADRLIVTDAYGQPYIYTLLYFGYTPEQFHQGVLANVAFHSIDSMAEEDVVYVGTPNEIDPDDAQVVHVVTLPGSDVPVFVVART